MCEGVHENYNVRMTACRCAHDKHLNDDVFQVTIEAP